MNGVLYNKSITNLILYPEGKAGAFTIPNGVKTIGGDACADCTGLTSVTIPGSVKTIGFMAFEKCTSLTSISFLGSQAPHVDYETLMGSEVFFWIAVAPHH